MKKIIFLIALAISGYFLFFSESEDDNQKYIVFEVVKRNIRVKGIGAKHDYRKFHSERRSKDSVSISVDLYNKDTIKTWTGKGIINISETGFKRMKIVSTKKSESSIIKFLTGSWSPLFVFLFSFTLMMIFTAWRRRSLESEGLGWYYGISLIYSSISAILYWISTAIAELIGGTIQSSSLKICIALIFALACTRMFVMFIIFTSISGIKWNLIISIIIVIAISII